MNTIHRTEELLKKLRKESDPKFAEDMGKVADSLERLMIGAAKGGRARAKKLSKKRRTEIAKKAAKARWAKPSKGEK